MTGEENFTIADLADEIRNPWRPSEERNLPYIALEHIEPNTLCCSSIGTLDDVASQGWRFEPTDILFGKMRPYFRKVVVPNIRGVCSGEIAVIRSKCESDKHFVFYNLAALKFIEFATINSKGDRPRTKWTHFSQYPIKKFDPEIRQRIGEILSLYDSLIQNNRSRIALLEQAARHLYEEWFERLRFPGHEKVEILDGVPEGWRRHSISDLCLVGRGASPRPIQNYMEGTVPWFKIGDATASASCFVFETKELVTEDGAEKSVWVDVGDLILSNSATCGIPFFAGVSGCIHDGWLHFSNYRRICPTHLYCILQAKRVEIVSSVGDGCTQKNLNTSAVGRQMLLLPDSDALLTSFRETCESIFAQIFNLSSQMLKLSEARDLLLSRLMSGEITV